MLRIGIKAELLDVLRRMPPAKDGHSGAWIMERVKIAAIHYRLREHT